MTLHTHNPAGAAPLSFSLHHHPPAATAASFAAAVVSVASSSSAKTWGILSQGAAAHWSEPMFCFRMGPHATTHAEGARATNMGPIAAALVTTEYISRSVRARFPCHGRRLGCSNCFTMLFSLLYYALLKLY